MRFFCLKLAFRKQIRLESQDVIIDFISLHFKVEMILYEKPILMTLFFQM